MTLVDFQEVLNRRMGLDANSIGLSALERALQQRMTACGASTLEAYGERFQASDLEFQELVEAVVVPETWFFRDAEAFAALVQFLRQDGAYRSRVLRVLSIPCATGEEPYSLAMALLEGGFAPSQFRIEAVDISVRALDQARAARYGKNAFRGTAWEGYRHYFEETGSGLGPVGAVRQQVSFHQGNLVEPAFMPGLENLDAVFCRNLLIYFDRPAQERAFQVLRRLLVPNGLLFVGAAETGSLAAHGFVSIRAPMAFAFRRATPVLQGVAAGGGSSPRLPARKPALAASKPRVPTPILSKPVASKPTVPVSSQAEAEAELARATRLADEGLLAEAAAACEAYLSHHPPTAHAYYLLGLVCDATGKLAEAAQCYRKALYLEPAHSEALTHLGLVLEKTGDLPRAKVMQRRAHRSLEKNRPMAS